jgi:superfamily II DNA helicase RecQ
MSLVRDTANNVRYEPRGYQIPSLFWRDESKIQVPTLIIIIIVTVIVMTMDKKNEFDDEDDDAFWENINVVEALVSQKATNITTTTIIDTAKCETKRSTLSPFLDSVQLTKKLKTIQDSTMEDLELSLQRCMHRYFGFSRFRTGQLEAIQAVLQGNDVAVFWSTGSGKSMTYILPCLYSSSSSTNTCTCLVISPLISLMQDQCHKLNQLGFGMLATYLGSAQKDPTMEQRALQGEFRFIFCTPEKLQSKHFLEALGNLSSLGFIAIDEAHCVR